MPWRNAAASTVSSPSTTKERPLGRIVTLKLIESRDGSSSGPRRRRGRVASGTAHETQTGAAAPADHRLRRCRAAHCLTAGRALPHRGTHIDARARTAVARRRRRADCRRPRSASLAAALARSRDAGAASGSARAGAARRHAHPPPGGRTCRRSAARGVRQHHRRLRRPWRAPDRRDRAASSDQRARTATRRCRTHGAPSLARDGAARTRHLCTRSSAARASAPAAPCTRRRRRRLQQPHPRRGPGPHLYRGAARGAQPRASTTRSTTMC